ncbi:MAG TPA: hypothetical protein VLG74_08080 [Blastocatellia bacterium]|nr:hypothetical protein [Blastocatellia bacterium]
MNPLKVKRRAANLSTSVGSGKPEQTERDCRGEMIPPDGVKGVNLTASSIRVLSARVTA